MTLAMPLGSRWQTGLLAASLALGASGTWLGLSNSVQGESGLTCRSGSIPMRRLELVLGMSRKGKVDVGDAEWAAFLEREVTPRFPDGLTVLSGFGQWRGASGAVRREPARIVLVWAATAPALEARVEAIRTAWKTTHDQESVLRADGWSCVSF